ncbi:MAG: hypothetical protein EBX52_09085, partial [Proteobacteria bacterium]|nr:hypothetical protein [Pseudomonadota bacterium]
TEHFHFIYPEGYFAFTERAAVHYEHAHTIYQPILKWTPRERTTVLIHDNADSANGFTMPLFRVGMVLIATPPETWFSTSYTEDWIKLLVFHEYVHFLNIDPTSEWMETLRLVFGDAVRPNGFWPPWMLEGLAVYFETRTGKLGRGRSPYYEGILRAFVNENKLQTAAPDAMTLDRLNGDYPWFPGGESAYRVPYFIEGNLTNVMHRSWSLYWYSFINETRDRMAAQIEAVKKEGETRHEAIATSDYEIRGGVFSPDGTWLAYSETSLDDRARLIVKNTKTGEKKRLDEKILGVGLAFTPDSRYVIYSALVRENSYQLYSDLFAYDLLRDRTIQLTSGKRAKDPALSPDGRTLAWLTVDHATPALATAELTIRNGEPSLGASRIVFTPKLFSILSSPQFLDETHLLFSNQELGAGESMIESVDTATGSASVLLKDGFMNRNPIARQGRIVFVSNQSGIENVHELKNGKTVRVTNVITGTAFPFFSPDGALHADLLTSKGYQLVRFESPSPEPALNGAPLAAPQAPASLEAALQSPDLGIQEQNSRDYSPWSSLAPRAWSPIASLSLGTVSGTAIDAAVFGFDSTGKHQYEILGGYRFLPKTFDFGVNYTLYTFRPVIDLQASSVTSNIASGPFDSWFQRTHTVALRLSYPLLWARSALTPSLTLFNRWNRLREIDSGATVATPDYQFTNAMVPGIRAGIGFSNSRSTRLGFMPEMGDDLSLVAEDRINTAGDSISKYLASWKHYFGFGGHSVLRTKAQWFGSSRRPESTLTSTDLAGKNPENLFDRGETLSLSQTVFRGYTNYPTASLHPRSFEVGALDYHFPIGRTFSGADGTTPVFFKQLHGFVFTEALFLQNLAGRQLALPSFGGGVSLDTTLLLRVPLRFNLEYQQGTRTDYGGTSILFFSIEPGSLI